MSAPSLTLAHRPDLGLVIARWQREITPAELRTDYLAIRAAADAAGCGHWLLDLRRRDDIIEPVVNAGAAAGDGAGDGRRGRLLHCHFHGRSDCLHMADRGFNGFCRYAR
jgi:hypothetical protein